MSVRPVIPSLGAGVFASIGLLLYVLAFTWLELVNRHVPEPYLDEFFHHRQAKSFLQNNFRTWDPKITTPPGLYLLSYVHVRLSPFIAHVGEITVTWLRYLNCHIGYFFLPLQISEVLVLLANKKYKKTALKSNRAAIGQGWSTLTIAHMTLNTCLFPPLFFFYALYYTDVASTLSVVYVYKLYLSGQRGWVVVVGLVSLCFRQTNIFWVATLMGALDLMGSLAKGRPALEYTTMPSFANIINGSWEHSCMYDSPVNEATFADYIKSAVSVVIASLSAPKVVMRIMWPYFSLLATFGSFVLWNGGVVLGDKDNHIASIHLAHMLYLWPYIAFFSWPLLLPTLLDMFKTKSDMSRQGKEAGFVVMAGIYATIIALMLGIVHYNTIVHPFTLADNRHYMFYVFRILRYHWVMKYLAVPIYCFCAWAVSSALGESSNTQSYQRRKQHSQPKARPSNKALKPGNDLQSQPPQQNNITFVLAWLLATSLSLITAPLVEPRYFILPWIFWRLHMTDADPSVSHSSADRRSDGHGKFTLIVDGLQGYQLWLETIWFLLINTVTGYMFLHRGFEWPQEPGKIQRFMW